VRLFQGILSRRAMHRARSTSARSCADSWLKLPSMRPLIFNTALNRGRRVDLMFEDDGHLTAAGSAR